MAVWLVRAGTNGEREDYALENDVVVVGWSDCPDFSKVKSREELLDILESIYPDCGSNKLANWGGQLWSFVNRIQIGDIVALPLKSRSAIIFGEVTSSYQYEKSALIDTKHRRHVKWIHEVPRSEISQDLLYSFGAYLTVCRIKRNNAEERIASILNKTESQNVDKSQIDDEDKVIINLEENIRDQIRSRIERKFKGHRFADLVSSLLEALGYQTVVATEGPDGGVDIFAGKGDLGFENPRIVVQVKSSSSPVDVTVVRQLQGVVQQYQADYGLFVSWGGYKSSVRREFLKNQFQLRLWSGEDVLNALFENYDHLNPEIQAELPLKRVWMLALSDETES